VLQAVLVEGGGVFAQRQPDEVGLRIRHGVADREQVGADPVPLGGDPPAAGQQLAGDVEAGQRGGLGQRVDTERQVHLAQRRRDGLGGHAVPDPQAGQAVRLGEGAQHGDVRPVTIEVDAVGNRLVADVLAVGLVEHDQAVGGYLVEDDRELIGVYGGAGRVVRVADEDQPGTRGDRGRHRGQVVGLPAQRDPDRVRRGQVGQDRVRLE